MKLAQVTLAFKRFVSLFRDKPIELGNSVSLGDEVIVDVKENFIDVTPPFGSFYQLRQIPGSFQFVTFVKSDNSILYQLKHNFTGETINVTKNMFEFLFEKHTK